VGLKFTMERDSLHVGELMFKVFLVYKNVLKKKNPITISVLDLITFCAMHKMNHRTIATSCQNPYIDPAYIKEYSQTLALGFKPKPT